MNKRALVLDESEKNMLYGILLRATAPPYEDEQWLERLHRLQDKLGDFMTDEGSVGLVLKHVYEE